MEPTGVPIVPVVEGYAEIGEQEQAAFGGAQLDGYPLSVHSLAYEQFHIVTAGPARLFGFEVYSSKASSQWIQLFDTTATTIASGAIPVAIFVVAATSNLPVAYPWPGRWFNQGIVIANSTTGPTQTAGSADCYFDVQYFG